MIKEDRGDGFRINLVERTASNLKENEGERISF